jgi:hypothetical protein
MTQNDVQDEHPNVPFIMPPEKEEFWGGRFCKNALPRPLLKNS